MDTAIIRIYGIRPAQDGSGNVLATVEAFHDGKPLPGRFGDVVLTQKQFADVWAQPDIKSSLGRLIELTGQIDARFTAEAIGAFLGQNAVAAAAVDNIAAVVAFPLDLVVEV